MAHPKNGRRDAWGDAWLHQAWLGRLGRRNRVKGWRGRNEAKRVRLGPLTLWSAPTLDWRVHGREGALATDLTHAPLPSGERSSPSWGPSTCRILAF